MNMKRIKYGTVIVLLGSVITQASAVDFMADDVKISWDSQIIGGLGLRTKSPSCDLVGGTDASTGCSGGGNVAQWGNGSLGDLNYKKNAPYSEYIKGTTELLVSTPDNYKFMLRDTLIYDQGALNSATPLSSDAQKTVAPNNQLLDLWVSKSYTIDEQSGHIRVGNQVLNWGESYFAVGGLSATNSMDIQKLFTPGVQIKEAVLPAPMISIAQGLGNGFNLEAYYQFGWNHDRFPAVGTFWSTWNQLGMGKQPIYYNPANYNVNGYPGDPNSTTTYQMGDERDPRNSGQYGLNLHYKPQSVPVDFGFYVENYHDKTPVFGYDSVANNYYFNYLADRKVYGLSANMPIGDFAVGAEVSYRPHDAVSLTGCFDPSVAGVVVSGGTLNANPNTYVGNCQQWTDMKKIQYDVVGQLNMQPSDYPMLNNLGANFAVFTIEGTLVSYPDVSNNGLVTSTQGGQTVVQGYAAGYGSWLNGTNVASVGTANSMGATMDFNWTYDGTLIPGWQVTPGVTFFDAIQGNTPNFLAQYEQGFESLNFYVYFNQNPAVWQAGANFTHFMGGNPIAQPFSDRDNIGLFLTRNF